jgi:hypothetical protein
MGMAVIAMMISLGFNPGKYFPMKRIIVLIMLLTRTGAFQISRRALVHPSTSTIDTFPNPAVGCVLVQKDKGVL